MIDIKIDTVNFHLREYHDFSWLHMLGNVFCVYDQQDSGNILFGIESNGMKKFVKYAGARTLEYEGEPEDAIIRLKNAISVYEDIKHPDLIKLEQIIKRPNGMAAVFEWFDGAGLHDHWTFGEYNKYTHPKSSYYQYRHMPVEKRIKSINVIFEFLAYVESINYVAVDFYDGSILYDFKNDISKICDIDFFRKKPAVNDIGENFWGTKRLKAPEEYVYGATIDGVTTVYTLGALIFHLFGGDTSLNIRRMYEESCFFPCSLENWELSKPLYEVTLKAVNKNRSERYNSISDFFTSWNKALLIV
jgi:serine/threonine-protein kinase